MRRNKMDVVDKRGVVVGDNHHRRREKSSKSYPFKRVSNGPIISASNPAPKIAPTYFKEKRKPHNNHQHHYHHHHQQKQQLKQQHDDHDNYKRINDREREKVIQQRKRRHAELFDFEQEQEFENKAAKTRKIKDNNNNNNPEVITIPPSPNTPKISRAPSEEMIEVQMGFIMAKPQETKNILTLQMEKLIQGIEMEIDSMHKQRGSALCSSAISHIFSVCEYLELSDRVKYAAVEIYDRFMIIYNEDMEVRLSDIDKLLRMEAEKRLKAQVLLRIATCIQLASKAYGDEDCYPVVSEKIHEVLQYHNQSFALKAINASELRVLELLSFNVQCTTTLDVLELVLIQLNLEIKLYRIIYELCISLLDYVYYEHSTVYDSLFDLARSKNARLDRTNFKKIEYNKLIEASGIIACCIYLVKASEYKSYAYQISALTKVDANTFTDLAVLLINFATEKP